MKIRSANEQDLLILSSWFVSESEVINWGGPLMHFPLSTDPKKLAQLKADIEWSVAQSYALIEKNGNLIGFAQSFNKFGYKHLGRIVISPKMRGRKLGHKFMQMLLDSMSGSAMHFSLFVYDHNVPAKKLYERIGFNDHTYPVERSEIKGCRFMVKT